MKKIILGTIVLIVSLDAGLPEKIAASYSAKYEVCALKLKDKDGYKLKSLGLKIKADKIHKENVFKEGYLKALEKEKKSAWFLSIKKCKKIADSI